MCGIAGIIERQNHLSSVVIDAMMDRLFHRGPDAGSSVVLPLSSIDVALLHRRLSIIDHATGANQPMAFEHLVLTFNGEIYNFLEIKKLLLEKKYIFDTKSDTEVLLKAFHCWGVDCVHRFRGMFAFCVVDKKQEKMYLVRDRVGVKPLYYAVYPDLFLFASEMKVFFAHPAFRKNISSEGLGLFFQFGYIHAPWTIFEKVYKIRPGHYLEYDLKNNSFDEKCYWQLSDAYRRPRLTLNLEEAADVLEQSLLDAILLRRVSDVPIGVFLSGGIDSTLVAAMLQSQTSSPIKTFTMGFDSGDFDESTHAQLIAAQLGTAHHAFMCTKQAVQALIPALHEIYDEPFADHSALPTALLARETRTVVTVALSGDGGDEMFCGYPAYDRYAGLLSKTTGLTSRGLHALLRCVPDPISPFYRWQNYFKYLKFKSILDEKTIEARYHALTMIFTPCEVHALLQSKLCATDRPKTEAALSFKERMMLVDFNGYLPDDILVKVDRATMHASLEGREPLLDHLLLEQIAQLPFDFKRHKFILKYILKKYLPVHFFDRKKHGFGVPLNTWLRADLRYLIDHYLDSSRIKRHGLLNDVMVQALKKQFFNTYSEDQRIWTLLVFQMWHEAYCE